MSDQPVSESLRQFNRVSNVRGTYDVCRYYITIAAVIWLACHFNNPAVYVVAFLAIGTLQHGLSSLQHEAWHFLCFRSHKVNDFVGGWFYAYPIGGLYHFNQVRHRGHHAYFGGPKDPDRETYINYQRETAPRYFAYFVGILLGRFILEKAALVLVKTKQEHPGLDLRSKNMPSTRVELVRIACAQLVLMAIFTLSGNFWNYWLLWFLPLATVAAFLSVWRQFTEHATPSDDVPSSERLFDFDANFLERLVIAPVSFNLHAFHHSFPKIPHYRLRQAKKEAKAKGVSYSHIEKQGYIASSLQHLRALHNKLLEEQAPTTSS